MVKLKTVFLVASFTIVVAGVFYTVSSSRSNVEASISECGGSHLTHDSFGHSANSSIRKLSEYETVCGGATTDTLMVFTAMPTTQSEAQQFARSMATTLKTFAKEHLRPLVVFEPSLTQPTILLDIKNGKYDEALTTYYRELKSQTVTDAEMGMWVLFPEANTPTWHTTHPADFVVNVRKVAQLQKHAFPTSKVSILLNSRTYPDNDASWNHGEIKSLIPYVADLPKGLIDSFGYQGFPSASAANTSIVYSELDARDFLPVDNAIQAAQKLGTKTIWFNTGSFRRMYAGSAAAQIELNSQQRSAILQGVVLQAKQLRAKDFYVSVNLFAADKSKTDEHIDWSYWQPGPAGKSADTSVFKKFLKDIRQNNIGFSLYDEMN